MMVIVCNFILDLSEKLLILILFFSFFFFYSSGSDVHSTSDNAIGFFGFDECSNVNSNIDFERVCETSRLIVNRNSDLVHASISLSEETKCSQNGVESKKGNHHSSFFGCSWLRTLQDADRVISVTILVFVLIVMLSKFQTMSELLRENSNKLDSLESKIYFHTVNNKQILFAGGESNVNSLEFVYNAPSEEFQRFSEVNQAKDKVS